MKALFTGNVVDIQPLFADEKMTLLIHIKGQDKRAWGEFKCPLKKQHMFYIWKLIKLIWKRH
jgi:hypothetical protein